MMVILFLLLLLLLVSPLLVSILSFLQYNCRHLYCNDYQCTRNNNDKNIRKRTRKDKGDGLSFRQLNCFGQITFSKVLNVLLIFFVYKCGGKFFYLFLPFSCKITSWEFYNWVLSILYVYCEFTGCLTLKRVFIVRKIRW